jgi:hypothetical protein
MPSSSNSTTVKAGGTPTAFSNEATTKLTANTVYQITDATKRVLDPNTALLVEVDPDGGGAAPYATAAASSYTVDYMFGRITFAADQGASATVRVSGKYIPISLTIAEGNEFDLEDTVNLLENTKFGDTARGRFNGVHEASGSFTLMSYLSFDYGGGVTLQSLMQARTPTLLEYRPGGQSYYWRAWVLLENESEKGPLDGRYEGTVKFCTVAPYTVGENEVAFPTWGT